MHLFKNCPKEGRGKHLYLLAHDKTGKQTHSSKINSSWGVWLAWLEERETPDLGVVRSSPMLGVEIRDHLNK